LWKARKPLPHLAFRAEKAAIFCGFRIKKNVERGKRDDILFRAENTV
jgi:hypothetical protein